MFWKGPNNKNSPKVYFDSWRCLSGLNVAVKCKICWLCLFAGINSAHPVKDLVSDSKQWKIKVVRKEYVRFSSVLKIMRATFKTTSSNMNTCMRDFQRSQFLLLLLFLLLAPNPCQAGSYSQKKAIHDTLLTTNNYNPDERPLLNQSEILYVDVMFDVVSIVAINDVLQSFRCNGFLGLTWRDEVRFFAFCWLV